jgi:N-acetylneuraminic acid mutarotase
MLPKSFEGGASDAHNNNNLHLQREESKQESPGELVKRTSNLYEYQSLNSWSEVRVQGKCPERRAYHSSFIHNKRLYIYGGYDIKEGTLDSLYTIEIGKISEMDRHTAEDQDHSYSQQQSRSSPAEWKRVETLGVQKPGALSHHSSVVVGDRMYLYGGSGPRSKQSEQEPPALWALDLKTFRWEVVNGRGEMPAGRDDHSAVVHEHTMVVFGGFVDGERTN